MLIKILSVGEVDVAPTTKAEDLAKTKIAVAQALQLARTKKVPIAVVKPIPKAGQQAAKSIAIYTTDSIPAEATASMKMIAHRVPYASLLCTSTPASIRPMSSTNAVARADLTRTSFRSKSVIASFVPVVANDILSKSLAAMIRNLMIDSIDSEYMSLDDSTSSDEGSNASAPINQKRLLVALPPGNELYFRISPNNFEFYPNGLLKRCLLRNNLAAKMFVKDASEQKRSVLLIKFLVPSFLFHLTTILTQVGLDLNEYGTINCEELLNVNEGDILITLLPA